MTAEVGVLNAVGVALAADSAVSLGPNADKIYSSADKLFHLSESAPVGIMINGNATFLGIPWETIIKSYRRSRKGKAFPKLVDYRDDFFRYVRSNRALFPVALQRNHAELLSNSFLLHLRESIKETLDRRAEIDDGLDERDISLIVHEVVKKNLDFVTAKPRIREFGKSTVADIQKSLSKKIAAAKKDIFGELPINPTTQRMLTRLVVEVLTRDYMSPFMSGVIFAGFGDDEFLPRLYSNNVEIMIRNKVRSNQQHNIEISEQVSASIVPFAQQEMVHTFLNGIDPSIEDWIRRTSDSLFQGFASQILDQVDKHDAVFGKALRRRVTPAAKKVVSAVHADWEQKSKDYWEPIMSVAASLPKDELGSLAEALVNLTKFRRRVSQDRETVGGPIDVAVITKGDGFVWVKRKHYFEPELNPRVIAGYAKRS